MHQYTLVRQPPGVFQFPLLGIFRCTFCGLVAHRRGCGAFFQFPLLGIFRCTIEKHPVSIVMLNSFNSRYLGFSVAPFECVTCCFPILNFQFPLLGIFRCTSIITSGILLLRSSAFNSRYLGFSVAPINVASWDNIKNYFQFPLLGIFRCTLLTFGYGVPANSLLSIPVTWDFPLHLELDSEADYLGFIHFQFPLLGIFRCTPISG